MVIPTRTFENRAQYLKHLDVIMQVLEKALQELSKDERTVFEGLYFHKQNRLQIADQLRMSVWQVDTLHHRVMRKLRDLLEAKRKCGDNETFCEAFDEVAGT